MKKLIAALALSAAGCAQAASVELYGQLDTYIAINKNSGEWSSRLMNAGAAASHWGLRGSEDLGGGNRLVFNLDAPFQLDTGAAGGTDGVGLFTRQCWVGIQSQDWGFAQAGRIYPPYSIAIYLLDSTDFSIGSGFSPYFYVFPGGVNGDAANSLGRLSNSLSWISPEVAGWQLWAFAALGEHGNSSTKGNTYNLSASFRKGPLFFMASFLDQHEPASLAWNIRNAGYLLDGTNQGYVKDSVVGAALDRPHHSRYWLAGFTYDMGFTKPAVLAVYRKGADKVMLPDFGMLQVGTATPLSGGRLSVSAAYYWNWSAKNADSWCWGIRYDYPLSKRTKLYAGISGVFNEQRTKFSIEAGPDSSVHFPNRYGVNQNQVFFGVTHSF